MGDKSDNIPGIPGVGEKTALKLLHQFGTVENVLENADTVSGKKLQEKLKEFTEEALMSKSLATINRAVPLDFTLVYLEFKNDTEEEKYELYIEYEFNYLLDNMDATELEEFLNSREEVNAYDIKRQIALLNQLDIRFNGFSNDIMMASFLLDPSTKIIDVSETVGPYGININSDDFHYGKGRNKKNPSEEETIEFLTDKVMAVHTAKDKMVKKLAEDEMSELYYDLEVPLSKVLADMEIRGIRVMTGRLVEMEEEIDGQLKEIQL